MVKVGFIVEGDTEMIIFKSDEFNNLLKKLKIECVGVFNAGGRGNLTKEKDLITKFFNILADKQAEKVFVISDLENAPCITKAKDDLSIYDNKRQINIVVSKAIESWFLADSKAISHLLKSRSFIEEPERTAKMPFDELRDLVFDRINTGPGNKKLLAKKILKSGFSIEEAAKHPNCKSAKYFIEQLRQII